MCIRDSPTLAEFDWRFNPKVPRQACFELHTLKFITEGINGLLIGKPGTGKSHIAKAVAYQATLQGYEAVSYTHLDVYKRQDQRCCGSMTGQVTMS